MDAERNAAQSQKETLGRRSFISTAIGSALAALAGWMTGVLPEGRAVAQETPGSGGTEARIAALETKVAQLERIIAIREAQPLAQLEGERNERVVFQKNELTVTNPQGVLLNLVATNGPVGIRFYKDFGFGNEKVTNPWHMGYIEGLKGYQSLAILRDWRFTAALWGEDGKLIVGSLDPHPPANPPAEARFEVRGTLDELQALIKASRDQTADVFRIVGGEGNVSFAVDGAGNVVVGSRDNPKEIILYDTVDGEAYSLSMEHGRFTLKKKV